MDRNVTIYLYAFTFSGCFVECLDQHFCSVYALCTKMKCITVNAWCLSRYKSIQDSQFPRIKINISNGNSGEKFGIETFKKNMSRWTFVKEKSFHWKHWCTSQYRRFQYSPAVTVNRGLPSRKYNYFHSVKIILKTGLLQLSVFETILNDPPTIENKMDNFISSIEQFRN